MSGFVFGREKAITALNMDCAVVSLLVRVVIMILPASEKKKIYFVHGVKYCHLSGNVGFQLKIMCSHMLDRTSAVQ